jgi:hypothetical protein
MDQLLVHDRGEVVFPERTEDVQPHADLGDGRDLLQVQAVLQDCPLEALSGGSERGEILSDVLIARTVLDQCERRNLR